MQIANRSNTYECACIRTLTSSYTIHILYIYELNTGFSAHAPFRSLGFSFFCGLRLSQVPSTAACQSPGI